MNNYPPLALSFDDVLLRPQFSDVISRKQVSIKSELGKLSFDIPVISSPMDTVTERDMAIAMAEAGGLGIVHRYNSVAEQAQIIKEVNSKGFFVGAAIGATGDFLSRAGAAIKAGAKLLCIDVAHGHHATMRYALQTLRKTYGYDIHIMAGNVATREAVVALAEWGASSVRVGIGGGSICSTRIQTGHGVPTFQTILDCCCIDIDIPIIADGGIRSSGDMVKALAAGACMVMCGSLLAGTIESPGKVIISGSGARKVYRGMASKEAQYDWRGRSGGEEGVTTTIAMKGSVKDQLANLCDGIRSGLSYSGCSSIDELYFKADFLRQTPAGTLESSTHIFNNG